MNRYPRQATALGGQTNRRRSIQAGSLSPTQTNATGFAPPRINCCLDNFPVQVFALTFHHILNYVFLAIFEALAFLLHKF